MRIDINPVTSKEGSEFAVFYNEKIEFKAVLPSISLDNPLYASKIEQIKLYDSNNVLEYETQIDFIKNIKQNNISLKYVLNSGQDINQLSFISEGNVYNVYYEEEKEFKRYILEHNNRFFYIYPVEDGVIRHLPIYDHERQIGEGLNLCDTKEGNDEYRCFLKEEYCYLADGITCFLLFMDRNEYSSSYITDSQALNYDNTNKEFYDKGWLSSNFQYTYSNDEDESYDNSIETKNYNLNTNSKNKIYLIIGIIWIIVILLLFIMVLFFV